MLPDSGNISVSNICILQGSYIVRLSQWFICAIIVAVVFISMYSRIVRCRRFVSFI